MGKKRWLGLLLVLVTLCSLAGCGKKEEGILRIDGFQVPDPVTAETADLTKDTERETMMYTSVLEQDNCFITHNVMDYGAAANGIKDDGGAIAAALDAAKRAGGGVVFLPAGSYRVARQLVVPTNVTLCGEWREAGAEGFTGGTTLLVDVGRGDGSVSANAAFLRMSAASKLARLNIYYPEQNAAEPVAYPYTVANNAYLGFSLECVNLVNPYRGIRVVNHNVITFDRLTMSPIREGMYVDLIYDIPRYTRITMSPQLWLDWAAATRTNDSAADIRAAVSQAVGMRFGKQDWAYLYDLDFSGLDTAVKLENSENGSGSFNGQFYNVTIKDVDYGFRFQSVASVGVSVARADIDAKISAVRAETDFHYPAHVFFNASALKAGGIAVDNGGDGALMFTQCTFRGWGGYALANLGMGYVNADTCTFEQAGKVAHIGKGTAASAIVDCTFAGEASWDNESASDQVYLRDSGVSESIPRLATAETFAKERRSAAGDMIFYAADFGAVADANYLNFNTATDNTVAIQRALNAAGSVGGGIVYLEPGDYYVKEYLVVPVGVELRGVSETNRHFGVSAKGTTLVTGWGEGSAEGKPFLSLKDRAGLRGLNVFYLNQHYAYHIAYPPTVFAAGEGCYLYDVTIPNAYTAVLATGKDLHVDYLRGLGVSACLVLNGADDAYIENTMLTGGDWQDAEKQRLLNAPPVDLWTNHPNYRNEGIYVKDSDDVTLFQCFVFGMASGLHLVGEVNRLTALGLGVDAADNAVLLEHKGSAVFVNTQLVGNANYIHTTEAFSGAADFYLTAGWFGAMDVRNTFNGSGTVRVQQYKVANGGVDVGTAKVYLQNLAFDLVTFTMVSVQPDSQGYLLNSVGTINVLRTEGSSDHFAMINIGKR